MMQIFLKQRQNNIHNRINNIVNGINSYNLSFPVSKLDNKPDIKDVQTILNHNYNDLSNTQTKI